MHAYIYICICIYVSVFAHTQRHSYWRLSLPPARICVLHSAILGFLLAYGVVSQVATFGHRQVALPTDYRIAGSGIPVVAGLHAIVVTVVPDARQNTQTPEAKENRNPKSRNVLSTRPKP